MATQAPADRMQRSARAVGEQARAAFDDATQAVRSSLARQKDGTADSIQGLASALRRAAREGEGQGEGNGRDATNQMADWAADGLERLSASLHDRDLDGLVRDIESFARRQPVVFFLGAAALGFLGVRLLKAGSARPDHEYPANPTS